MNMAWDHRACCAGSKMSGPKRAESNCCIKSQGLGLSCNAWVTSARFPLMYFDTPLARPLAPVDLPHP